MNANNLLLSSPVYTNLVNTMPKPSKSKKREEGEKGETITFRPLKADEPKIQAAEQLTGLADNELALLCMQKHLDEVVAEVMAEQDRMRRKYAAQFALQPEPAQSKSTVKPAPVPKGR